MYSLALENEVMAALPDLPDPRRGEPESINAAPNQG